MRCSKRRRRPNSRFNTTGNPPPPPPSPPPEGEDQGSQAHPPSPPASQNVQSEQILPAILRVLDVMEWQARIMKQQVQSANNLHQQTINLLQQQMTSQPGPSTSRSESGGVPYEKFKKLQPPRFVGSSEPIDADDWVRELERLFSIMDVTDEHRVRLATFMLGGEARHWWEETEPRLTAGATGPLTWPQFKNAFSEKYFPYAQRIKKEQEFLNLKQGKMSVSEYDMEFTRLSRFSPDLVKEDLSKCNRFLQGLNVGIREHLSALEISKYSVLVNKAMLAEQDQLIKFNQREQQKRSRPSFSSPSQGRFDGSRPPKRGGHSHSAVSSQVSNAPVIRSEGTSQRQIQQGKTSLPHAQGTCVRCGKAHAGTCRSNTGACYNCGQPDHFSKDCPHPRGVGKQNDRVCYNCGQKGHVSRDCRQGTSSVNSGRTSSVVGERGQLGRGGGGQGSGAHQGRGGGSASTHNRGGGSVGRPKSHGRVFAMTQQDAQATPDVVTCTISLFGRNARVLIDPGSTHSFISLSFAVHVDKPVRPLGFCLSIDTPVGDIVLIKRVY